MRNKHWPIFCLNWTFLFQCPWGFNGLSKICEPRSPVFPSFLLAKCICYDIYRLFRCFFYSLVMFHFFLKLSIVFRKSLHSFQCPWDFNGQSFRFQSFQKFRKIFSTGAKQKFIEWTKPNFTYFRVLIGPARLNRVQNLCPPIRLHQNDNFLA